MRSAVIRERLSSVERIHESISLVAGNLVSYSCRVRPRTHSHNSIGVNTRAKIVVGRRLPLQERLCPIERHLRTNDLNRPADQIYQ